MINCPPEIMRLTIDPDEYLVHVPAPLRITAMMNTSFPDLRGKRRTEPVPPIPNCLVTNINAALEEKIFDLPK